MTFSVEAAEYSPLQEPQTVSGPRKGAFGTKTSICSTFYNSAECPCGALCQHAHHVSELTPETLIEFTETIHYHNRAPHFLGLPPSHRQGASDGGFISTANIPEWWSTSGGLGSTKGNHYNFSTGGIPRLTGLKAGMQGADSLPFSMDYGSNFQGSGFKQGSEFFPSLSNFPSPSKSVGLSSFTASSAPSVCTPSRRLFPLSSTVAVTNTTQAGGALASHGHGDNASNHSSMHSLPISDRTSSDPKTKERPNKSVQRGSGASVLPSSCHYPHDGFPGTYYDILNLPPSATHEEIIARYRQWHRHDYQAIQSEDTEKAEKMDYRVVEARNVLGNAVFRQEYDQSLQEAGILE